MNLNKLFQIQAVLDNRIVEEHNLQGVDLLDKKILSLQVELGELANEWRGFKFWKVNPKPRTKLFKIKDYMGKVEVLDFDPRMVQENFYPEVKEFNPLLEEYVDCLHFILSIGLELNIKIENIEQPYWLSEEESITDYFRVCFYTINKDIEVRREQSWFNDVFFSLKTLGEMLGFTWEQIETAYLEKNKVNHKRQENGY